MMNVVSVGEAKVQGGKVEGVRLVTGGACD